MNALEKAFAAFYPRRIVKMGEDGTLFQLCCTDCHAHIWRDADGQRHCSNCKKEYSQ